jgi:hypothetical protein
MRCLHCGKELALLKRLRGGGQFCSEAHKQSYQEEYNRIALSRLLQAQAKPAPAKASAGKDKARVPDPPSAPVAVEAIEEEAAAEAVQAKTAVGFDRMHALDAREAHVQAVEEEPPPTQEVAAEEPELEAIETAGFLAESQASVPIGPQDPDYYVEDWQRGTLVPVMPNWQFDGWPEPALPGGDSLRLVFRPDFSTQGHPAQKANAMPTEFVPSKTSLPGAPAARIRNRLQAAGPLTFEHAPKNCESSAVAVLEASCDFAAEPVAWESELLFLFLSEIAFPAEDSDVTIANVPIERTDLETGEIDKSAGPSDATEALARLHQELAERAEQPAGPAEAAQAEVEAAPADAEVPPVEAEAPVTEVALEVTIAEPAAAEPVKVEGPPVAEVEAEARAQVQAGPDDRKKPEQPKAGELVEFSVKMFAPSKPAPMEGVGILLESRVLVPRLTGLPLRPKLGLVSPQTAQSLKAAQSKSALEADAKTKTPAKPDTPAVTASKPAAKPATAPVQATPAARPSQPAKPVTASAWQKPQATPAAKPAETPATGAPPKASNGAKKGAETANKESASMEAAAPSKTKAPATDAPKKSTEETEVPSFGIAPAENSLWAAHKTKIIIAVAVLVIALIAYLVVGGKSGSSTGKPAVADQAGPSIMVGAGGWQEGWAGDLAGEHLGRQITIYRPSLKLSDYRIEFQGEVETKSLGWVFRAADPQNYYAMKLAAVTPGLTPKIALFKYIIADGHQSQVGRVPIDIQAHLDTIYKIRVDVRGTTFATYVQGQLVDTWNDDQLKTGGVGFLNEREERGKVKSAQIFLLNGGKQ